ncbi:MAG TPA: FtsQ-type POTRA domain-containing protein [Nocardioides sp.]|nr:FtsQ-type POTRA domain-containing protein [Nocardioides sp.]
MRTRTDTTGTTPAVDPATLRSRKRFARRQWARRWLAWRRVVALLLLIALMVGTVWLFYFSDVLAVKEVEVHGTRTLAGEEVREVASVPPGQPLARVDLDAIRARIEALAVVRHAAVTRAWPDRVLIDVEERVAIAVVEIGGRIRGLDAEGVVFRNYPKPPPGMPQVRTSTDTHSDALQEAALVVEALPAEIDRRVDHVEVATVDQISLVLRDGKTVVWGSAEESDAKAEVLTELLEQPARTYDVSVPGQPTTSG